MTEAEEARRRDEKKMATLLPTSSHPGTAPSIAAIEPRALRGRAETQDLTTLERQRTDVADAEAVGLNHQALAALHDDTDRLARLEATNEVATASKAHTLRSSSQVTRDSRVERTSNGTSPGEALTSERSS